MSEVKSTAEACYDARIALIKERDELARQVSELQLSQQNIINAFGISGEGAHSKLVIEYVHGLVAENVALKAAVPALKEVSYENDSFDDVSIAEQIGFNEAVRMTTNNMQSTPNTEAAIDEIGAKAIEDAINAQIGKPCITDKKNGLAYINLGGIQDFAANLRAGRK